MDEPQRDQLERDIRGRIDREDLDGAATAALRGYGPEIFEFLAALHRNVDDASEVFSLFAEGLWRNLPNFAWQCSFRTWAYAIARKASLYFRRGQRRRTARIGLLQDSAILSQVAQQIRSDTLTYLRTENRNRVVELRNALPEEDQVLLMLRVDRRLSFLDLAQVMHGDDEQPLAGDSLKKEAARLRKRFQMIKEKLYEMARREGLVGDARSNRTG